MNWKQYAFAFVRFSGLGMIFLYLLLRVQELLPWFFANQQQTTLTPDLSFNTAVSFATTTTWQAYAGDDTMSYLSQIVGLASQNFLAGAAGLAIGIAFIRGLARDESGTIGNFWVDVTRATLWVLLPASIVGGLFLVWQGVPFNLMSSNKSFVGSRGRSAIGPAGSTATAPVARRAGQDQTGGTRRDGQQDRDLGAYPTGRAEVPSFHHRQVRQLPDQVLRAVPHLIGQLAQQQGQRPIVQVDLRPLGDLRPQGVRDLGDQEHAPDLGQDQIPVGRPEQVQPEIALDRLDGQRDVPAPSIDADHVRDGQGGGIEDARQVLVDGLADRDRDQALEMLGLVGPVDPQPDQLIPHAVLR